MKNSFLLILLLTLVSCQEKKQAFFQIKKNQSDIDSLFLTELLTGKLIAKVNAMDTSTVIPLSNDSVSIGVVKTRNDRYNFHLILLQPDKHTKLRISDDTTFSSDNVADSLLNYISKSTNTFIGKHQNFIYNTSNTDSIVDLFQALRDRRRAVLKNHEKRLSEEELELLNFQSEERINAFLLFFGRVVKRLSPNDTYFRFINSIDLNTKWAKTLPDNILYKHEINYLHQYDSLTDITNFINYIDKKTKNRDLFYFLKAFYLRDIIESPSYWEKHQKLFDSMVLRETLEAEDDNPYQRLFKSASDNYFATSKGKTAFEFTAQRIDGSRVTLSDFQGQIVFIDTWATWCGTCIRQKSRVYDLADKYKNEPRVEVIFISVDSEEERWKNYINRKNEDKFPNNFLIKDGMRSEFGNQYNIKSLPRYILIDAEGRIINANILEPSAAVVDMIEKELENM